MCLGIQEVFVVLSGSFVSTHSLKRATEALVRLPGLGLSLSKLQEHRAHVCGQTQNTCSTAANLSNSPLGGVTQNPETLPLLWFLSPPLPNRLPAAFELGRRE